MREEVLSVSRSSLRRMPVPCIEVRRKAERVIVYKYRHSCRECGREFHSVEALDSLCQRCLDTWGLHGVDEEDESAPFLLDNEFDEENYGYSS